MSLHTRRRPDGDQAGQAIVTRTTAGELLVRIYPGVDVDAV